ncbi:hypothetical protein [Methylorubrum sp. SL192]|uniref:hypothetical protein n=1 Tax=Methylorubrum sp. SL192 TaxID=2995167 RepID=UPI001477D953|nr:hypothetical protein [Methylorubrum sp. SL192]MCY1644394.1 hypothetical protein [Methylorubrum sp. SL192]
MSETEPVESAHRTVAGVELVTIPLNHYAELLDCQRRLVEVSASAPVPPRRPLTVDTRSRLFDDPEVAAFLIEIAGTMRLTDARSACVDRFGAERAPSRSTINRFWQQHRNRR